MVTGRAPTRASDISARVVPTLAGFEATPIVILADSGGAATAVYQYCMHGMEGVEETFRPHEALLRTIKRLNEVHQLGRTHAH